MDLPATVSITLSQGPSSIQIPDLTGRPLADARSALEQLGLKMGAISRDTSSFMPENTILAQLPRPGSTVSAGATRSSEGVEIPPGRRVSRRLIRSFAILMHFHLP